ncbi:LLM class flavin-dependent oxidoreductase [Actinoplanes sp. NPDC026619]|uniref:LLM class flavin-dependent oxidoreductase n=1 Tax=Actinoplanes sp. NPDC026619 TaxID=3155798 RepID=UPI003410F281
MCRQLPTAGDQLNDVVRAARHAERLGLASVWAGDHLSDGRPILECTVALAAAAAVTDRISIGFGVYQIAMRPLAWAAKQLGSLQFLSGNRLIVGVGTGGGDPGEWRAAGVPPAERGARTDRGLAALRPLLGGVPAGPVDAKLEPAVPAPPIWIGGGSARALRRAAEFGDGWLATVTPPDGVAAGATRLRELSSARGRPDPAIACCVIAAASAAGGPDGHASVARFLTGRLGLDPDRARRTAMAGDPPRLAEQLHAYLRAGVDHLVLVPFGGDWERQYDLFAAARALL